MPEAYIIERENKYLAIKTAKGNETDSIGILWNRSIYAAKRFFGYATAYRVAMSINGSTKIRKIDSDWKVIA